MAAAKKAAPRKAAPRKRPARPSKELQALADILGISDDAYDEVPDDVLVSVGELDDPPDLDEVN